MDRLQSSKMLRPPTVTAKDSGLSRAPLHVGQGTSRMNVSVHCRTESESESRCRRLSHGTTPSNCDVNERCRP